ncbi:hypothetical protein GCM10027271_42700 [Saccharopolyspora gloriosae]|uniref:Secreted protein n=1 Tax=Saccharopolyspora gloriosae TaxID=455344 RepID=A0A840NFR5_9PSEU|nr:hypothetical protein [Saccharopolyspora gloriosae]MBB5070434.1 hypothetical protein [Saccharopolyspora gloriosae]
MSRRADLVFVALAALGSSVLLAPPVFADGVVVSPGDADGLYGSPSIDLGAVAGGTPSNPGRPGSTEPGSTAGGGVAGPPLGLSWSAPGSGVPEWFTVLPEFRFPDFSAPAPPSPGVLAGQAAEQLQLPLPTPSHSPDVALPDGRSATVVGEHTWFWTEPARWEPVSRRVQAGAVWAEVTATPERLSFDPGNEQGLVSCPGPGTPYDRSFGVHAPSPDCDVVYQRSSADEPGEQVRAQWAITWAVSWRGFDGIAPTGGQLPDMTSRAAADLAVVEAQALTTG